MVCGYDPGPHIYVTSRQRHGLAGLHVRDRSRMAGSVRG